MTMQSSAPSFPRVASPPLAVGAAAVYPWDDALAKRFVFSTRFDEMYQAYRRAGPHLLLPRNVIPHGFSGSDHQSDGKPVDLTFNASPRNEDQARIWQETWDRLQQGQSFQVQAATGSGKTLVGALAAAACGMTTLVLVPKQDLVEQWHDTFQRFLGLEPAQIGHVQADKVKLVGRKVAIGMLQSLSIPGRYPQSVYDWAGLVVIDEAHRCPADQMIQAFFQLTARQRLALSATPKRSDGKEVLLHMHVGPIAVKAHAEVMKPKVLLIRTPWACPRVMIRDEMTGRPKLARKPHSPGRLGWVMGSLAECDGRNEIIMHMTTASVAKDRVVIIFCDLLDHVERLLLLLERAGVPPSLMSRYVGGMTAAERAVAKTKKVLVSTVGAMKEGTDIPRADTAILAATRADIVQMAGRVLREHPDKKQPVIIDLQDDDSKVLRGYASKRMHWYQSIGAEVVQL